MLFRCSKCGKFRRYGTWIDVPQRLLTQIQHVPISHMLCQNCEKGEGYSESPMYTDDGGTHEPFIKGNWDHKRECCRRNNGNEAHTIGGRLCLCGNH